MLYFNILQAISYVTAVIIYTLAIFQPHISNNDDYDVYSSYTSDYEIVLKDNTISWYENGLELITVSSEYIINSFHYDENNDVLWIEIDNGLFEVENFSNRLVEKHSEIYHIKYE